MIQNSIDKIASVNVFFLKHLRFHSCAYRRKAALNFCFVQYIVYTLKAFARIASHGRGQRYTLRHCWYLVATVIACTTPRDD